MASVTSVTGWMMYLNDQTVYEVGETYTVWMITGAQGASLSANASSTFVLAGAQTLAATIAAVGVTAALF